MIDIEKLRGVFSPTMRNEFEVQPSGYYHKLLNQAADEIENLRTTVSEDLKYQSKLEAELRELRAIYDGLCK